jgi:hypothetical protein
MVTPEEYDIVMGNSHLQQQLGMTQNIQQQQQAMFQEQEKGLAEEQLDVKEIIRDIFKLLTGKKITIDMETGNYNWEEPKDNSFKTQLRILSDYGIQKVMEKVIFYVNKSVLLSNYDDSEINRVMYDFTTCLNDFVLMRYEGFFYEPTFEECVQILKNKMEYKEKLRFFTLELLGMKPDIEKIKKDIIFEMEGRIGYEIDKIKKEELKKRINEYDSITMEIEHQVYNTYKRAEGGMERSSLRKHAQFTEVRALQPEGMQKKGGMFGWLKGS